MTPLEAQRYASERVVVALSGPVAERRLRRGSGNGWVPLLSREFSTAVHESGHCVAQSVFGSHVCGLSIIENREAKSKNGIYHVLGFSSTADSPEGYEPPPKNWEPTADWQTAARYASLLAIYVPGEPRWRSIRRTIRELRSLTERLIAEHWLPILELASELERRGEMRFEQIEPFVKQLRNVSARAEEFSFGD